MVGGCNLFIDARGQTEIDLQVNKGSPDGSFHQESNDNGKSDEPFGWLRAVRAH